MEHEIGFGDLIRLEQRIRSALLEQRFVARRANLTVDDDMRHVNTFGPELARQALGYSPEGEFGRGQVDEARPSPKRCSGAGEDDGAAAAGLATAPRRCRVDDAPYVADRVELVSVAQREAWSAHRRQPIVELDLRGESWLRRRQGAGRQAAVNDQSATAL